MATQSVGAPGPWPAHLHTIFSFQALSFSQDGTGRMVQSRTGEGVMAVGRKLGTICSLVASLIRPACCAGWLAFTRTNGLDPGAPVS